MATYYNEFDPKAAAWLRVLITKNLIPSGEVDERPIQQVSPDDLKPFTQCHFFAGIGGWPYALRLAGWPDNRPVWTGSCPCQPFSVAGKGKGVADDRHLWPVFRSLIEQSKPDEIFGEQVASAAGRDWLAGVQVNLEDLGFIVGAGDYCSAGVNAPNIRQRLFWVAHSKRAERWPLGEWPTIQTRREQTTGILRRSGAEGGLANNNTGLEGRHGAELSERAEQQFARPGMPQGGMDNAAVNRREVRLDLPTAHDGIRPSQGCDFSGLGNALGDRRQQRGTESGRQECVASTSRMGNSVLESGERIPGGVSGAQAPVDSEGFEYGSSDNGPTDAGGSLGGFWGNSIWHPCTDNKIRRIPPEPAFFPLASRIPGRVAMLRGFGSAINPVVAAEFIGAYLDSQK